MVVLFRTKCMHVLNTTHACVFNICVHWLPQSAMYVTYVYIYTYLVKAQKEELNCKSTTKNQDAMKFHDLLLYVKCILINSIHIYTGSLYFKGVNLIVQK